MSDKTEIGWTDSTWNPVRGCTKISSGCKNCYAETLAERWRGIAGHPYEQGFDLRTVPDQLALPLRWKRPRRIFVNSMSDLFHKDVPFEYIAAVFGVMAAAQQHTFQVLTKRPDVMRQWFEWFPSHLRGPRVVPAWAPPGLENLLKGAPEVEWPLPNAWLGVSVEDRKYGLPRVDLLRDVPAAVRMLSIEPLLEDLGEIDLRGIDWVIVGGESGPGARPMPAEWVRPIRRQCAESGVPFFFKQWGGTNKKAAGNLLDGVTHEAFPEVPCR